MWKQILYLSWLVAAGCSDIADREYPEPQPAPAATTDSQATVQTRNLLGNLRSIAENGGTLFGHQCSSLYGIGWSGDVDRSDVKSICGDYPAMMGWDLAQIELWDLDSNSPTGVDNDAKNIDGDKFTDIRNRILEAYARGGVTTIGWHTTNPATGGTAWDVTAAVGRIIPGGDLHEKYCGWLDKVAAFMLSLRTDAGEYVPVLFRPFHEHTGNGFWWGKGNCTADQYIALWRFTLEYLRDTKGVHNLLYVYSPDIVSSQDNYLEFWPGDAYVDVLGLDAYDRSSWAIETNGLRLMRLLKHIAYLKNKPFAFHGDRARKQYVPAEMVDRKTFEGHCGRSRGLCAGLAEQGYEPLLRPLSGLRFGGGFQDLRRRGADPDGEGHSRHLRIIPCLR